MNLESTKKSFNDLKRMIYLIYKNYRDGETQILAISLTYYSLLAVFPFVALILGITRGFGFDKIFIKKMFELLPNSSIIKSILSVAQRLLASTEGNLLAGIGIIVLIYSVVKVLIMLENSFNKIWRINKKRSLPRRIVDYVAIIFLGPIFFVALSALNSFVIDELIHYFSKQSVFIDLFIAISGPLTYIILFSFIFYLIPNTNVKIKPALIAGFITTILTFCWKLLFLLLQSIITSYNIIYGSLALIPIFLIFIQYIWVTILLGAQIAFSIQTSDKFLYKEEIEMPIKIKREAGMLILSLIIKNFAQKKEPFTFQKLSDRLGMDVLFVKDILSDLEKMGFVNEVFSGKNSESIYQIAYNPEAITINEFMKEFDTKNIEYYADVFKNLNREDKRILEKIQQKLAFRKIEKRDIFDIQFPENVKSYNKQGIPTFLDERPKRTEKLGTIVKKEDENLEEDNAENKNEKEKKKNENENEREREREKEKKKTEKEKDKNSDSHDNNDDSENDKKNNDDGNNDDDSPKIKYENGKWKFL